MMSRPLTTVNGCSLEDCYTNLFALTELDGIRWCKLVAPNQRRYQDPLEDPILKAYNRGISKELLCVWKRTTRFIDPNDYSTENPLLNGKKELWVFWYKDQPHHLPGIRAEFQLKDEESGQWEHQDQGNQFNYQCRILLFKAIHNLIEKHLIAQGFVRIGKWFLHPYTQDVTEPDKSVHFSFSFSFFLHGESTVCASVDVRQHPILYRLHAHHLLIAEQDPQQVSVLLAPYGMAGTLTGAAFREGDPRIHRMLHEWKEHFYIDDTFDRDDSSKPPLFVEVVVAGTRLKYPSCFVLTENAATTLYNNSSAPQPPPILAYSPPCTPCPPDQAQKSSFSILSDSQGMTPAPIRVEGAAECGMKICFKAWRDASMTPLREMPNPEESNPANWDYMDPTAKSNCLCNRIRQRNSTKSMNKSPEGKRSRQKIPQRIAFHVRTQHIDQMIPSDIDFIGAVPSAQLPPNTAGPPTPYTKSPSVPTFSSNTPTPSVNNTQPITPHETPSTLESPPSLCAPSSPFVKNYPFQDAMMPVLKERFPPEDGFLNDENMQNFEDVSAFLALPLKRLRRDYGESDSEISEPSPSPSPQPSQTALSPFGEEERVKHTLEQHSDFTALENIFESDDSDSPTPTDEKHNNMDSLYPTPPSSNSQSQTEQSPCPNVQDEAMDTAVSSIFDHQSESLLGPLAQACNWPTAQRFNALSIASPLSQASNLPKYTVSVRLPQIPQATGRNQHSGINEVIRKDNCLTPVKNDRLERAPSSYDMQSPASNASSYAAVAHSKQPVTSTNYAEANAILLNVLLYDSLLNLFKDHNFDSCPLCACNMNIRGSDAESYLVSQNDRRELESTCVCGFSAVMNRRYAIASGLFMEDQMDITGMIDTTKEQPKPRSNGEKELDAQPSDIMTAVRQYFMTAQLSMSSEWDSDVDFEQQLRSMELRDGGTRQLEIQDGCAITWSALELSKFSGDPSNSNPPQPKHVDETIFKESCLHKWPYFQSNAKIPANCHDVVRLLNSLNPLLQDAIQKKNNNWDTTYNVMGPLTWKDFHLLARRGTDEASAPQPIPQILAGYDKEWISVAPYSLRYWDKLLMEPYSAPRDVTYVVLAPEHDYVLDHVCAYIRELSDVYESCHLGRHRPIDSLRQGILRIGKQCLQMVSGDVALDDWFKLIGNTPIAAKISIYARICKGVLAGFLAMQNKGIKEEDNNNLPTYVVYVIDPFSGSSWPQGDRLATLGFFRCFDELCKQVGPQVSSRLTMQIISQHEILAARMSPDNNQLKTLALSVYTKCSRILTHRVSGRCLTGFGPAAEGERRLNKLENPPQYKLFTPPFTLTNTNKRWSSTENTHDGVLFVGYCLSEDQKWLLAAVTDNNGELLDTCTINIYIPNRGARRSKASARKIGLKKLWQFIIGLISGTLMSWRLVIGRFGRIGHGELKGWAGLLSRDNLTKSNSELKEVCSACSDLKPNVGANIVGACLISMEAHQSIQVMPDCVKVEEKSSSSCPLSTPRDASSTTHILVLPTSATAQYQTQGTIQPHEEAEDLGIDYIGAGEIDDETLGLNFDDILKSMNAPNSPVSNGHSSPTHLSNAGQANINNINSADSDPQEIPQTILQQPLAIGFYVSTAATGALPRWFWSACPQRAKVLPVCLKAALHLHNVLHQTDSDEFASSSTQKSSTHPLDSNLTSDVLRYVLETYNALSWLTFDFKLNDRRSCLPVHFVVLMQIYHAINKLI
ncbi:DgyrCDS13593 [Dimorphilus gyrociliatus]|uniref:Mediator of RNA polymerase II transcription subunit 13 n=1 Tax=Dimorphilus gyrociliatus TaxID=2664684 RepID=A0A7I8WB34_9ANNE|nr:DgyrCDS13593 [Dimorphilus gyrociliatus]